MANILVAGGTGYVGSVLVNHLLARGDEVTVLSRGKPTAQVRWIQADLTDESSLTRGLDGKSFDVIHHTASLPGDTGDPQEMVRVNVVGLMNLLEFARQSSAGRFVLASSISAYEWFPATKFRPPLSMPVSEDHPCRPEDMYSSTKRMQEILAMTYYHQYEVPVSVLRLTAVVGPGGSGGGAMWREFAEQLRDGKRVQLPMFSPEEWSHFVDVRDVAEMHILAGEHPDAVGEIFNCCAAKATRGSEFAQCVQKLAPQAEVAFGFPWSMAQGGEIKFDMTKMRERLGFEPRYTLEDAVQSIHDWVISGGLKASE